jgi:hypothetical protein
VPAVHEDPQAEANRLVIRVLLLERRRRADKQIQLQDQVLG